MFSRESWEVRKGKRNGGLPGGSGASNFLKRVGPEATRVVFSGEGRG